MTFKKMSLTGLILGPPKAGKTTLLMNFLQTLNLRVYLCPGKGTSDLELYEKYSLHPTIISPLKFPAWLEKQKEEAYLNRVDRAHFPPTILVVEDLDVSPIKEHKTALRELFSNHRHYKIWLFVTSTPSPTLEPGFRAQFNFSCFLEKCELTPSLFRAYFNGFDKSHVDKKWSTFKPFSFLYMTIENTRLEVVHNFIKEKKKGLFDPSLKKPSSCLSL